jgi:sulfofructose kinase
MNQNTFDCVGLGISPSDYICLLDHYPKADEKTVAKHFSHQGGGPVSTALAVLGRWGGRAALLGVTGDDEDGRFVRAALEADGVDTRWFRLLPGARTPRAFIWVDITRGSRTVVLDNLGVPALRARDLRCAALPPARIFHTDGREAELCLKAMRHYRRAGAQVVIDMGSPRQRMEDLLAATDHLVTSHTVMRHYFGPRARPGPVCREWLAHGPRTVVITLAEKGCFGATRDGGEFMIKAHHRDNFIVDTTGAGDVFHGAYIYGLLQNWPAERCAALANAAAFLKCAHPGGRLGIPALSDVLALTTP